MYECLYGFTPFACEDRHQTKLKILQHKKTLTFPEPEVIKAPSIEALDLMIQILVEKERRLCSRQYELNDFTRKIVGGRVVRCAADKAHQNYQGYFVYPGDAEDIKRHAFFREIEWDTVHLRRPPYVPRVKDWEDTKYFDEEEPISDIDTATTIDECEAVVCAETVNPSPNCPGVDPQQPLQLQSQKSQHHHEDQNIVPSMAIKVPRRDCPVQDPHFPRAENVNDLKNPLMPPPNVGEPIVNGRLSPGTTLVETGIQVDGPTENVTVENIKPNAKRKEKKRPRDVILRDPSTGPQALETRKLGAFLGYEYRQPMMAKDIVEQVLAEDLTDTRLKSTGQTGDQADYDLIYEKRVFVEAGGQLSPRHRPLLM